MLVMFLIADCAVNQDYLKVAVFGFQDVATVTTRPHPDYIQSKNVSDGFTLLACGMYSLPDSDDGGSTEHNRQGYLGLYRIVDGCSIVEVGSMETEGIFELSWYSESHLFAVHSDGSLRAYYISQSDKGPTLQCIHTIATDAPMLTSLAMTTNGSRQMVAGGSNGHLYHGQLGEDAPRFVREWSAHTSSYMPNSTVEIWTVAFDTANNNLVYSGGDDSLLKMFDLRSAGNKPVHIVKQHESGVTSIQSAPVSRPPHELVSGSYDEQVRFWDTRKWTSPVTTYHVGGGAWQTRWNSANTHQLAVACMQNGWCMLEMDASAGSPKCMARYVPLSRAELVYGVDWVPDYSDKLISCDFHSNELHLLSLTCTDS